MTRSLTVLVAVALWAASACTSSGDDVSTDSGVEERPSSAEYDRSLPEGEEPEVLGPLGETEMEFETESGAVQIGVAQIPASVASTFPVPDDLTVQISSVDGDASGFTGVTQLTFADLIDLYEVGLPDAGYQVERSQFVADVFAVLDFTGPDGSGQIAISSAPGGGRSVLVTFAS